MGRGVGSTRAAATAATVIAVVALAGCTPSTGSADKPVTVFAAASLTESFAAIADAFEAEHPGVSVTLNFGGSSSLATQLAEGAPADVFASASPETMPYAGAVPFATNVLWIVVPVGNPGDVASLRDFADPGLVIAVCAPEVPCGAVAAEALRASGVEASVDTYEQDVKAVLTKVELGEVDAGLVYRTDVLAAGSKVHAITTLNSPTTIYPIVALPTTPHPESAAAFVDFVLSDAGQAILRKAGFGAP
ncbi:MAG: molybdate ABC transporter substrate-binding protein [Rhodoglobus sp.]